MKNIMLIVILAVVGMAAYGQTQTNAAPEWVRRQTAECGDRIRQWAGEDPVVLVPVMSDFHLNCPTNGVWPAGTDAKRPHLGYFTWMLDALGADLGADLGDHGFNCIRTWRDRATPEEREARIRFTEEIYAHVSRPLFCTRGNHDGGLAGADGFGRRFNPPDAPRCRGLTFGPTRSYGYCDLASKRTRVVFIDTCECAEREGYRISDGQVAYLRQTFAETPDGWNVLVFTHDCLHLTAGRWETPTCRDPPHKHSAGYAAVRELLERTAAEGRVRLLGVICGDSHFRLDYTERGVRYLIVQGYATAPRDALPTTPARAIMIDADLRNTLMVEVAAVNVRTGELRMFRFGTAD